MEKRQVEILFRQHYRRMYAAAYSMLYDEQESKDAVSDVFASLLEGNVELLPDAAGQYLLTAVRHNCMNRLRDKTLCTCTITIDAIRKDPVEERNRRDKWKKKLLP